METRTVGAMVVLGGLLALSPLGQQQCFASHRGACKLPKAATATLRQRFPDARIRDVEVEKRGHGLCIYEAEIRQNGKEMDVQVSDTGTLVKIKTHVAANQLPRAVARALEESAGGVRIRESEKVETFVRTHPGEITTLPEPVVAYEIAFQSAGKPKREVRISAAGKMLEALDPEHDGEEEGHSWWRFWDRGDDDEDHQVEHGDRDDKNEHGDGDHDNNDKEDDD